MGGATGNLSSSVTLQDSSAFNEFFQAFTPGTLLSFRLNLTANTELPVPDLFSFSILDNTLSNLPTLSPSSDAFVILNLTGLDPTVETYASTTTVAPEAGGPAIGLLAPTVVPVPEPSTYGLIGAAALAGLVVVRGQRRQTARLLAQRRHGSECGVSL